MPRLFGIVAYGFGALRVGRVRFTSMNRRSAHGLAVLLGAKDRDRGEPRGSAPPTPPGIRVRTTAVRSSSAVGSVTRRSPGFGCLASPRVIRSLHDQHPRFHPDPPSSRPVAT